MKTFAEVKEFCRQNVAVTSDDWAGMNKVPRSVSNILAEGANGEF
jgi:hypothetical protein